LDPKNKKAGEWFRLVEKVLLLDWLTENESSFGASLEIITDKSQEGSQFVRGFGGIGGSFLSYLIYLFSNALLLNNFFFFFFFFNFLH